MRFFAVVVWLVLALWEHGVFAMEVRVDDSLDSVATPAGMAWLEEAGASLQLNQVRALSDAAWQHSDRAVPTLGYNGHPHWFRFGVHNAGGASDRLIETAYPVLNQLDVYVVRQSGAIQHHRFGSAQPVEQRPYPHRNFIAPLHLDAHERVEIYMRVQTTSSIQLPVTIWKPTAFLQQDNIVNILYGAYLGLAIIMWAYNLKLLAGTRDLSYFYYVCWVLGMVGFVFSLHGLSLQYVWPQQVRLNEQALVLLVIGIVASAMQFSAHFLDVHVAMPGRVWWVRLILWANGLAAVASFVFPYSVMIRVAIVSAVITTTFIGLLSIQRWMDGYRPARYFAISYSLVLLGGVAMSLSKFGLIARSMWTEHSVTIGSALEIVLLNLALADRHNAERRARSEAQQALYEWQLKQQDLLEAQVSHRTQELELANWQLNQYVRRMSRLQTGAELGASLIHELRQPLAAIHSFAQGALTLMRGGGDLTQLDRVLEKILATSRRGNVMLDRLRAFLVQDLAATQPFDLHDSLKDALVWVRPTCLQEGVEMEISGLLDGPLMALGDGVLAQQVLVNLLRNAVDAMQAAQSPVKKIVISTWVGQGRVHCRIQDTGTGVAPEVQGRLFDGGVSTKIEGMGLGLKLSRTIAQEMRGDLTSEEVAQGACFVFSLPAQKHPVSVVSAS